MIIITEERSKCVCGQFACKNEQEHQKIFDDFQKQIWTKEQIKNFWYDDLNNEADIWCNMINKIKYEYLDEDNYMFDQHFYRFNQNNLTTPKGYFYDRFEQKDFFFDYDAYFDLSAEHIKRIKTKYIYYMRIYD